jgi:tetratricopeptide (TPR) repeat protein
MTPSLAKNRSVDPPATQLARLESLLNEGMAAQVAREARLLAKTYRKSAAIQIVLGVSNMQLSRFDSAAKAFARAAQIDASHAAAWSNLGIALKELGRIDDSIKALERATRANPAFAPAHYNLGNAYRESGKFEEAIDSFRKAIAVRPDNALFHLNLGLSYSNFGDLERAAEAYSDAIRIDPSLAAAHSNLANTLFALDRLDEALAYSRQALQLRPDDAVTHYNYGRILREMHVLGAAETAYHKAIALDGSLASAHFNLGLLQMLRGDYEAGLPRYEWRKVKADCRKDADFDAQLWLGEKDIAGRTILLHAEQGLGDTIQFVRYAELVRERQAKVTLAVPPGLIPLVSRSLADVEVISVVEPLPRTDFQTHLLSLPHAFGTRLGTIPARLGYLTADPERVEFWRDRLGNLGFRIGICWQGSTGDVDKGRSFPLSCFEGIARLPGVRLLSLHRGPGEPQLRTNADLKVETFGADFDMTHGAFEDSAAVIMHCNLVITSDTAIAHLAGALGRPVWTVLKSLPDWRWMLERSDTPWYPTMRLFRQTVRGDWREPFSQAEAELATLLAPDGFRPERL